ncbi:hypothetical protein VF08_37980 [Nostoc linckia z8]|uniref:Uncharacterized protein n=1 Tax=Nostoc linckia z8 TaxID=1628746 RepID=A0A9Q6EHF7_NOSLI|nr:hypothetical protein VF08_37980 [Nostoc linckia z8]
MSEVAHLHARALDDAPVAVDQRIDLVGERQDLAREFALDAFGLAAADALQRPAGAVERFQAVKNGQAVDDQPTDADHGQRRVEPAGEEGDLVLDDLQIAGYAEARRTALVVEHDLGFAHTDLVADLVGHLVIALVILVEGRDLDIRHGEIGNAERSRRQRCGRIIAERLNQPVPAGRGLGKPEVTECWRAGKAVAVTDRNGIDDIVELGTQEIVEAAFHALTIKGGYRHCDRHQTECRPEGGKQQDARGERADPHFAGACIR